MADKLCLPVCSQFNAEAEDTVQMKNRDAGIFDRASLMRRVMEDDEFARGVIQRFLQDTPHRIAALKEALDKKDAPLARRHAHTLKGASATLGAPAMREASYRVEVAAESGDIEGAVTLLPKLNEQFEALKKIIST